MTIENVAKEITIDASSVKKILLCLSLSFPIFVVWTYIAFWSVDAGLTGIRYIYTTLWAVPILALSMLAHEGLHYLGLALFNTKCRHNISIRFNKSSLTPYVTIDTGVSVGRYRISVILPLIVLGLPLAFYGLLNGIALIYLIGVMNIILCFADVILFVMLLQCGSKDIVSRYRGVDAKIGFNVVPHEF